VVADERWLVTGDWLLVSSDWRHFAAAFLIHQPPI